MNYIFFISLLFSFCCPSLFATLCYDTSIVGVEDKILLDHMTQTSPILQHTSKTATSVSSLKAQAKSEIPSLKMVAAYYGYYDCSIKVKVEQSPKILVTYSITLGPQFSFSKVQVDWTDEEMVQNQIQTLPENYKTSFYNPTTTSLHSFIPQSKALGKTIAAVQKELLESLQNHGYAFAKILHTASHVSRSTHQTYIKISIQSGPIVFFGPSVIEGNQRTNPSFFLTHQTWSEGDLYTPKKIALMEKNLHESGLFQTIQIEPVQEIDSKWRIPITITVHENKPRTISAGIGYTTTYGGGLTGSWEHRNLWGNGQKWTSSIELWQKMCNGRVVLTIPHWKHRTQNLHWIIEFDHQKYMPFTSSSIKGSALVDMVASKHTKWVYGASLQHLSSFGIIGHKRYQLFKTPLQYIWSTSDNLLDPKKGFILKTDLTPSWQVVSPHYTYVIQYTTFAAYTSIQGDGCTFAAKISLGDIFGAWRYTIPLPDKFFGGSDTSLRGYKTGSVSPLNKNKKPIGGRSILTFSGELRLRQSNGFGYVLFYDVGQVFASSLPRYKNVHFLQSVGSGIRYTTPLGPIRLDIAFPMNRRRHIDPPFQLYFSVGQAF